MDLAIQGELDDIDTPEKVAHPSYKDKEQLDFQILLTENYYVDLANVHICFPIKIKKKSNNNSDTDDDLITVNIFFAHWVKVVSITKYGRDKGYHLHFHLGKYISILIKCQNISQQTI